MITVFHKGDAPEILAALKSRGLAFTTYDLRRGVPEAAWAAGQHLREIGRTRDLGGGVYELLTPTTTVDNALGRHVIAGDHPDTVLAALPPLDRVAVHDLLAPIHERRPDGRCSCKTSHVASILAEINVTEPRQGRGR